ncbi:MAG TPA: sulfite exporter TauE/SafE family protein [Thermoplasmata archaeon]|nr:sulfite exporter TauE/SafE family protein [Thermoplasmata archaeon]
MVLDPPTVVLQIVLMFGVAFIYSNLGLGGGLLFVPILLATGVSDPLLAAPISLTLTTMTAASSVINHRRKGYVDFRLGRTLVIGTLIGAVLGTYFHIGFVSKVAFEVIFVIILVAFGGLMVRDWLLNARTVDENDDSKLTPRRTGETTVTMVGSGFLSGLAGVGGGLMNVPLIIFLLGRKTRVAIGTSSLLIMPTAALGFFLYVLGRYLGSPAGFTWPEEFILIPILMPFVFVGALLGSRLGLAKLQTRSISLIFIVVIFIAAVQILLTLLHIL